MLHRETQEESHVKMQAQTLVLPLQAKDSQGWAATNWKLGEESWNPPSFRASPGQPCQHTDLGFLVSRTVRKLMSVVLSHHVCGICYGSPRKLTQYMIIYMHLYIYIKIISIPKMGILDCYNKNVMYIFSDS